MLEPDTDKRPNIFQVCHVVHHLRGFDNPVPNVFVSLYVHVCVCVHVLCGIWCMLRCSL